MPQVLEDKSQVNGGKAGDEATTDELPFALEGEKDLERLFDEYPKYLDEFNKDPKAFIDKHGQPKEEKPTLSEDTEDFLAEEPVKQEKKEPEKKPEAPELEGKLKDLTDKLHTALQEIDNLKKGSGAEKDKKKLETDIKDIDLTHLTDLPEDLDLYTDEGQEQAKKQFQALTKAIRDVTSVATAYKARLDDIDSLKNDVSEVKKQASDRANEESSEDAVTTEFKSLDAIVAANKDIFGEKIRPVREIEEEYLESIGKMLEKVANSKASVLENGKFSKEALKVIELSTGTNEKAKRFQQKCKEMEIGFPEDTDILRKVYEVRGIRNELSTFDKSGKAINVPAYERAIENYKGRHIGEFRVKDRVENKSTFEKAILKRKTFAPETRPGTAAEDEDISKMSNTEVNRILNTEPKKRTKEERESAYKILTFTGTPEKEARSLSGLDLKE